MKADCLFSTSTFYAKNLKSNKTVTNILFVVKTNVIYMIIINPPSLYTQFEKVSYCNVLSLAKHSQYVVVVRLNNERTAHKKVP